MNPEPDAGINFCCRSRPRPSTTGFCTWICTTASATWPTTPVIVLE
jgi:hypothetical protein